MDRPRRVKLGDLITFAGSSQPGEYGVVVKLEPDFVEIMWPWGVVGCSYNTFDGESWGHLKVVRDEE